MSYYSATILQDNPMAYYRLGEASGTTANDASGNGSTGTISASGVTLAQPGTTSDGNTSMLFDGVAGQITLPLIATTLTNVTMEAWVKLPTGFSGHGAIIKAGNGTSGYGFGVGGTTLDNAGTQLIGELYGVAWIPSTFSLTTGVWHHVVVTVSASGNWVFYVDGVAKNTVTQSIAGLTAPAGNWSIGVENSQPAYLNATLDEVAFYGQVLSASRILAHYQSAHTMAPSYPSGQTPGYYLLINSIDRTADSKIDNHKIETSISDRMPQVDITVFDKGCNHPVDIMQEVLILDASQPNQGVNLLLDPVFAQVPSYTVNQSEPQPPNNAGGQWSMSTIDAGTTITPGPPLVMAIHNILTFPTMTQWTQAHTVTAGQKYMLSAYLNITAAMTNAFAFLELDFYSFQGVAAGAGGGGSSGLLATNSASFTTTGGVLQRVNLSAIAPAGTAFIQVIFGIQTTNGTNSGTAQFSNLQLEPMWFPSIQSYPTYDINPFQAASGCVILPNGTTVRQTRIFAGIIADADPGATDGNNGYDGNNRTWTVGCKGPNWLLETQRVNQIFNSQTDASAIDAIVNTYFSNQLTTNGVQNLANIDQRSYDDNTVTDVLTDFCNTTGGVFYVNFYYDLQYLAIGTVQAPYGLSDTPDGVNTFGYQYWSCPRDGTQLQNAFVVHGGAAVLTTTDSFTANGSTKQFTLFNAKPTAIYSVVKGGTGQSLGVTGNGNFSFSNSQCLVDFPNHQINFQSNPTNGTVITCTYQYDGQIRAAVLQPDSIAQFNGITIWGLVNDTNLTTTTAAVQRGMQELAQFAFGLKTPHFKTLLQLTPGQSVQITNARESMLNATFVVQKVSTVLMGNGLIEYEVECGPDIPTFARMHKRVRKATDKSKHLAGVNYSSITLVVSDNTSVGIDSCAGAPA